MKGINLLFICQCICFRCLLIAYQEKYVSTYSFRACADFIVDPSTSLDPSKIKEGDIIYVDASVLYYFFDHHYPLIAEPFILITHNNDLSVPGKYAYALHDDRLIAWFGQNVNGSVHPKLYPIPIGLSFPSNGNEQAFDEVREHQLAVCGEREHLIYINFTIGTNPEVRRKPYELFAKKPFSWVKTNRIYEEYLQDITLSKFVLSPPGGGIDCFRTWEALYLGAIPIVKSSSINPLYRGLPIVVVDEWEEITEDFLHRKWLEIQSKTFEMEKLCPEYWSKVIRSFKSFVRQTQ